MSVLNKIIGLNVSEVEKIHDYVQLHLSNNAILNIFNNYTCNFPLEQITNKKVMYIKNSEDEITIGFEDEIFLSIRLDDKSYNGSEAMSYVDNEMIIVWN